MNWIEPKQYWYFTFMQKQTDKKNSYAKIWGTYDTARQKMVEEFGEAWAFQYGSDEEAGVNRFMLSLIYLVTPEDECVY